jgi:hypothetical protein
MQDRSAARTWCRPSACVGPATCITDNPANAAPLPLINCVGIFFDRPCETPHLEVGPFPGWGSITYNENASTANYNSLQATANRRFARGLQFGVAYTWSKTMDYRDTENSGVAMYRPLRVWNYGKAGFDHTHVFVFNYTYDLPRGSVIAPNVVTRFVLDNWQVSGITTIGSS